MDDERNKIRQMLEDIRPSDVVPKSKTIGRSQVLSSALVVVLAGSLALNAFLLRDIGPSDAFVEAVSELALRLNLRPDDLVHELATLF